MIINNSELKFAEKVILIDAAYINKVTKDLSQHFSQVIGRELPKADLPIFLECVAMDAAIQPGENVLQVLFVYDKSQSKLDAFNPSDLKKDLNDVAFKSPVSPLRIELFGDDIDRMGLFETDSQRITDSIDYAELPPARELIITPEARENLKKAIRSHLKQSDDSRAREEMQLELEALENHRKHAPAESHRICTW